MTTKTQHYTIEDIKRINKEHGMHFFSPATTRFFASRVLPDVYQGPGGIYFITSEQFDSKAPRLYTVRQFYPKTGNITTQGKFYAMTMDEAKHNAETLAKG